MELKCVVEEKEGKKGKYLCLVIYITDKTQKLVFLEPAESELLQSKLISKK